MRNRERIINLCNLLILLALLLWPSSPPFAEPYEDIVPGSSLTNEHETDWSERDNEYGKGGSSFEEQNPLVERPPQRDTRFITRDIDKLDRDAQAYQQQGSGSVRGQYRPPAVTAPVNPAR